MHTERAKQEKTDKYHIVLTLQQIFDKSLTIIMSLRKNFYQLIEITIQQKISYDNFD